jgi:hypothetical protein
MELKDRQPVPVLVQESMIQEISLAFDYWPVMWLQMVLSEWSDLKALDSSKPAM